MVRKWLSIDPDSLAGKLSLLLFDKIVLGAVIALAFFTYDSWKITEQRSYEDRTTLAFQRANYVKELVPVVADTKQDVTVRAQALTALIETRSIGDSSAFSLSNRLLEANLIRSNYPEHFRWNRQSPLLDALQSRMPAGLEALLNEYLTYQAKIVSPDSSQRDTKKQYDIDEFWSELFFRSLQRSTDAELKILDDDEFLTKYLWIMDQLVGLVEGETRQRLGRNWFARKSKGVRLLAALRGIGDVGRTQHAAGLQYMLGLITSTNSTGSNLRLAGTLIQLVKERGWPSKALATRCVDIMVRSDAEIKRYPEAFHRELSCSSYVEWYANTKRDTSNLNAEGDGSVGWVEIEPVVAVGLGTYLAWAANESIDASDYINGRPSIARPLAEILVVGVEKGQKPTAATLQVMSRVLSLSDTKAKALILEDLRSRWLEAKSKLSSTGP